MLIFLSIIFMFYIIWCFDVSMFVHLFLTTSIFVHLVHIFYTFNVIWICMNKKMPQLSLTTYNRGQRQISLILTWWNVVLHIVAILLLMIFKNHKDPFEDYKDEFIKLTREIQSFDKDKKWSYIHIKLRVNWRRR